MALSCHLSMDLWCQEMRDVCKGSSESLDAPCVRSAKEALWWSCHSSRAFFSPWARCDNKRKKRYEGEGTFSASPFELCWLARVRLICCSEHGERIFNMFELTLARVWQVFVDLV